LKDSSSIFFKDLELHDFTSDDLYLINNIVVEQKIISELHLFNLLKKKTYLNLATRKTVLFYDSAVNLLNTKHNIYNFFASKISIRLKIFFNNFIQEYLLHKNYLEKSFAHNNYLNDLTKNIFIDSHIFENISSKSNHSILNKFSIYFNHYFDKNIFFFSLKNYFITILNYTSFTFIRNFKYFLDLFLIRFNHLTLKLLTADNTKKKDIFP
jgi:hypothetical protein